MISKLDMPVYTLEELRQGSSELMSRVTTDDPVAGQIIYFMGDVIQPRIVVWDDARKQLQVVNPKCGWIGNYHKSTGYTTLNAYISGCMYSVFTGIKWIPMVCTSAGFVAASIMDEVEATLAMESGVATPKRMFQIGI